MKNINYKKYIKGFTLIELLATLAIMAIIAGALFPYIGKYTALATTTTNYRSLKLLQDAIDRYVATSETVPTWASADAGSATNSIAYMQTNNVAAMITELTTATNATLKQTAPAITYQNMVVTINGSASSPSVYVVKYRPKTTGVGVNLAGSNVPSNVFSNMANPTNDFGGTNN